MKSLPMGRPKLVNDPVNPAPRSRLGVIILGAGRSSRMGSPKLLLPWQNGTVLGSLLSQWQGLCPAQIAVVCRMGDEAISAELERLGFPSQNRIMNANADLGMFSSIQAAARWTGWVPGLTGWAIVLGDQPHLRTDTLRSILNCHLRHPEAICQPVHGSKSGHPVLLSHQAFSQLQNTLQPTLKDFLNHNSCLVMKCPVPDSGLALDMDTLEDYKQLLTIFPAHE